MSKIPELVAFEYGRFRNMYGSGGLSTLSYKDT